MRAQGTLTQVTNEDLDDDRDDRLEQAQQERVVHEQNHAGDDCSTEKMNEDDTPFGMVD